ncbi:putative F-box protein [Cardamine amara subsp. amara]|uniref:F-box protein n=1 Tax=Cardamine amara subsp. amara TaxID=228776 RepID=A0ABD1AS43_CARAN
MDQNQNQNQNQNQREEKMKSRDIDWSEICIDALRLILESLSFADFHRAKTVCSNWYSVSKSCVAGSRNRYPWLILFPESELCFKLLDLRHGKIYKTKGLEDEFPNPKSRCVASYGNWLLMLSHRLKFSIFNVFTGERIKIRSLSLRGNVRIERKNNGDFLLEHSWFDRETIINRYIKTAALWIDEETKDFVVFWIYNDQYLFSYKKGDDSWWHFEDTKCLAMAYNKEDQKLFVYTSDHFIKILDYSGDDDMPNEIVEGNMYLNHPFYYDLQPWEYMWKRRVAITTSGDVLIILSLKVLPEIKSQEKRLFYIFKMSVEGSEWERVDSLENQMLVFGDGWLTLEDAKEEDIGGGIIKSDSIYFVADDLWPPQAHTVFQSSAGVFDLARTEISWSRLPHYLSNVRWFVPGSDKK